MQACAAGCVTRVLSHVSGHKRRGRVGSPRDNPEPCLIPLIPVAGVHGAAEPARPHHGPGPAAWRAPEPRVPDRHEAHLRDVHLLRGAHRELGLLPRCMASRKAQMHWWAAQSSRTANARPHTTGCGRTVRMLFLRVYVLLDAFSIHVSGHGPLWLWQSEIRP